VPPLSITRLVAALVARWDAWRERRAQRHELEALSCLDAATLRDLGLEEGYASRAAAFGAAREQRDSAVSLVGRNGAW
jgi:uncharacterized protein YjiS (DUF1127 family)